jgi:hypothetical protein
MAGQVRAKPSIKVAPLSPSQQIADNIARRRKLGKAERLAAFLCSILFHFLLFIILTFSLSSLYKVKVNLDTNAVQILNLAPPEERVHPPQPKPELKSKPKPKSRPKFKPKPIHSRKPEPIQRVARKKLIIPQPNDVLAIKKEVISPVNKWEKQFQREEEIRRETEVQKKITYQERMAYLKSSPIIQKKLSYVDKLTTKMTITDPKVAGAEIFITVNLPVGNKSSKRQFLLTGSIRPKIRKAFLTVNDDTRPLKLNSESFRVLVTLKKGLNKFTILAMTKKGGVGSKSFQLLFSPTRMGPIVTLTSPQNGQQGFKAGQAIWVEGTVSDPTVTNATLFLNEIPIKMKVRNGSFKKKVFLPDNKINTFRVMAIGADGIPGHSAKHTVLAGYDIDINNPRPY